MRHPDDILRDKLLERSAVNPETAEIAGARCREWRGSPYKRTYYGRMWDGARLGSAHRLSHEAFIGPIPERLDVLHRCDNVRCIEPKHLWAGTAAENTADMIAKGRHLEGRRRGADKVRGRPSPQRGSKHKRAKLKEHEAAEIKSYRANRIIKPAEFAKRFGISESSVRAIWDGKMWAWLEVEDNEDVAPPRALKVGPPRIVGPHKKYAISDPLRPRVAGKKLRDALRGPAYG